MSLLVTGSIGIDTVRTPLGVSEECLGGSAVYFSMAASFFSPVRFVGVVGEDCPFMLDEVFVGRDVDLAGLEIREGSKTFRWTGRYHENMDDRTTEVIELNVLGEGPPIVPETFKDSRCVFLANTAPKLQQELLSQIPEPKFVAADTMNCWIGDHLSDLHDLLTRVDCLIINEDEAKMLAADQNLIRAGRKILELGPSVVVVKKGESGSMMCDADGRIFAMPAYPADEVIDPTGAGDSFAGGFLGYISSMQDAGEPDFDTLKAAVVYGTVTASFTIAGFSLEGLQAADRNKIDKRFEFMREVTRF